MDQTDQIKRDKNKLPTISNKVVSFPAEPVKKEVRFTGEDFNGNILLKALKFLSRGCMTELEVKLGQGACDTNPSKGKQQKD